MNSQWYRFATYSFILLLLLLFLLPVAELEAASPEGFADPTFRQLWGRSDLAVATGRANRSWIWGAAAAQRRYERFDQVPGAVRLVQYFDKARMEINDPAADRRSAWFVTCGLLVVELITGRVQVGPNSFITRSPATIPLAGDPINNPDAPTYAMLAELAAIDGTRRAPVELGQLVSATFGPAGVARDTALARPETVITSYDEVTGRNVPRVFQRFMEQQGALADPLFTFGRPITEAYWAEVRIAGRSLPVLFQAFERRLLTYNPANPEPWKVEMGNVGQHYYQWRYGHELRYAQPPPAQPFTLRETRMTLPTYELGPALRATAPGDPIFPYERLDRALVGPPVLRSYRVLQVENRFLTLTFLPELGGRLLQAVDRSSGRAIFYQNPVVKPSPFGQRGWWLGLGGLEWAAPTEEHGYLENLPWDMTISQNESAVTVTMKSVERQRGFIVTGRVTLYADEARFTTRLEVYNPTSSAQPAQIWMNGMLSPAGDNRVGPGLRFIAPTEQMVIHATNDRALPGPRSLIAWPQHDGRNLSDPASWSGYLGTFTPTPVPFLAAYDVIADSGAAVIHGAGVVGGKIFAFGPDLEPGLYTDDQSAYVELWSGAQATFWDDPPLAAGATRVIETSWIPLWGLGLPQQATLEGTVGLLQRDDSGLTVTITSPRIVPATQIVIRTADREIFRSAPLSLRPDQPLSVELPPGVVRPLRIEADGLRLVIP